MGERSFALGDECVDSSEFDGERVHSNSDENAFGRRCKLDCKSLFPTLSPKLFRFVFIVALVVLLLLAYRQMVTSPRHPRISSKLTTALQSKPEAPQEAVPTREAQESYRVVKGVVEEVVGGRKNVPGEGGGAKRAKELEGKKEYNMMQGGGSNKAA